VSGRGQHRDAKARGVDHLAVAERPAESAEESATDGAHRGAGRGDDFVDRVGVVAVLVADEHQRNPADGRDALDVRVVVGAGVDDDVLVAAGTLQHPGVGAVERQITGVVAQEHRRRVGDAAQLPVGRMLQITHGPTRPRR
jgi:hypothetical protein